MHQSVYYSIWWRHGPGETSTLFTNGSAPFILIEQSNSSFKMPFTASYVKLRVVRRDARAFLTMTEWSAS